jgi:hypothetical protein
VVALSTPTLQIGRPPHSRRGSVRDVDDVLADPAVDAVVVATPPGDRRPRAQSLEAGKYVLAEAARPTPPSSSTSAPSRAQPSASRSG